MKFDVVLDGEMVEGSFGLGVGVAGSELGGRVSHERGVLSMSVGGSVGVCLKSVPKADRTRCVFGRVVSGLRVSVVCGVLLGGRGVVFV